LDNTYEIFSVTILTHSEIEANNVYFMDNSY